jgi:hypothetical protein
MISSGPALLLLAPFPFPLLLLVVSAGRPAASLASFPT